MLAVELMDPGRTWDLLAADNSMMGNAKVRASVMKNARRGSKCVVVDVYMDLSTRRCYDILQAFKWL